jgi:hypothetical protein
VQDAQYFRVQAELYFELARHMSVRNDAEYCRVRAERYVMAANDLEEHPESATPTTTRARWADPS